MGSKVAIFVLCLTLTVLASGCSYSIHQSQLSAYDNTPQTYSQLKDVEVSAEQTVILGFIYDVDYADEAYNKLLAQCPGEIPAVNIIHTSDLNFLHWVNRITIRAKC